MKSIFLILSLVSIALAIPTPFTSFGNWIHNVGNDIHNVNTAINSATNRALNTVGTDVSNGFKDVAQGTARVTEKIASGIDTGLNAIGYYGHKGLETVASGIQTGVQDTTKAIDHVASDVESQLAPKPGHLTAFGKIVRDGDNFVNTANRKIDVTTNHVLNTVGTALNNGLNDADIGITNAANIMAKKVPFTAPVAKVVVKGASDADYYGHEGMEKVAMGIQKGVFATTGAVDRGANYIANEVAPTTTTTTPKPKASASSSS